MARYTFVPESLNRCTASNLRDEIRSKIANDKDESGIAPNSESCMDSEEGEVEKDKGDFVSDQTGEVHFARHHNPEIHPF